MPRYVQQFGLVLALLAGLLSCATSTPDIQEPLAPPQIQRTQGFVADAFKLIASGDPDSLRRAYSILDSHQDLSDYAADLKFLTSWLYTTLYPALKTDLPVIDPVPGSYFASMTRDISRGVYPVTRIEEGSYLFFVLPPLSVMFTDSTDTLDIAYESLSAGHDLNPSGTLPQMLLGYVEEQRGNNDEAVTWYISALQTSTECYPAAFGLVRIYLDEDRYEDADVVLGEVRTIIDPNAEFFYLKGKVDLALKRYPEAFENFSSARNLAGDDPRYLMGAAEAQFRRKEYDEALLLITEIRKRGSDTAGTALLEARVYRAMEQRLKAMSILNQAQERFPDNQALKDLYGQLLLETGRTSEGRLVLNEASREYSEDTARDIMLMDNAVESGVWQEARIYFEQAVKVTRDRHVLESGARIYSELGMNRKALDLLETLQKDYPDRPEYPLEALKIAFALKDTELAAAEIRHLQGKTLTPRQESRLKVGQARLAGNGPESRRLYEEAVFLDVRNVDALLGLADYYQRTGDRNRAELYLKQLERMPNLDQEALDRILTLKEKMK